MLKSTVERQILVCLVPFISDSLILFKMALCRVKQLDCSEICFLIIKKSDIDSFFMVLLWEINEKMVVKRTWNSSFPNVLNFFSQFIFFSTIIICTILKKKPTFHHLHSLSFSFLSSFPTSITICLWQFVIKISKFSFLFFLPQ